MMRKRSGKNVMKGSVLRNKDLFRFDELWPYRFKEYSWLFVVHPRQRDRQWRLCKIVDVCNSPSPHSRWPAKRL